MAPHRIEQGVLGDERSRRTRKRAEDGERPWGEGHRLPVAGQAGIAFVEVVRIEEDPQRLPDGNATGHSAHRHALSSRVARVFLKVSAHPACVNFVLESTSGALFGTHFVEPLGPEIGRGGSAGVFED